MVFESNICICNTSSLTWSNICLTFNNASTKIRCVFYFLHSNRQKITFVLHVIYIFCVCAIRFSNISVLKKAPEDKTIVFSSEETKVFCIPRLCQPTVFLCYFLQLSKYLVWHVSLLISQGVFRLLKCLFDLPSRTWR